VVRVSQDHERTHFGLTENKQTHVCNYKHTRTKTTQAKSQDFDAKSRKALRMGWNAKSAAHCAQILLKKAKCNCFRKSSPVDFGFDVCRHAVADKQRKLYQEHTTSL
jgi:hypothetical protein